MKLLLFDLDGTLLDDQKKISPRTLNVLNKCREKGILIGVSTSRSEQNCLAYLSELEPDIMISSGGALIKKGSEYIYKNEISADEVREMVKMIRSVCGGECEITIDTVNHHYWNYKMDPQMSDGNWGESIYSNFNDFDQSALKICVEIFEEHQATTLKECFPNFDCKRFSDGFWYKFTKAGSTKESAVQIISSSCNIPLEDIVAFGDDFADIGMLKLCGIGIAMSNAIEEVKQSADIVIGRNDEEGIAEYLEKIY